MKKGPKPVPFMDRIRKRDSGCWEWTGARVGIGYGQYLQTRAHRESWRRHRGPIPEGLHVLHRCDNPPCVNPAHLFLGTNADNMVDMNRKGRHAKPAGELNPSAKLTAAAVMEIVAARANGVSVIELAKRHGVTRSAVYLIIWGHRWKHVKPSGSQKGAT